MCVYVCVYIWIMSHTCMYILHIQAVYRKSVSMHIYMQ